MVDSISCLIVDDEADAIELMSARIGMLYKNIKILGGYTSWQSAFSELKTKVVDILILDISMPEKTGFELLKMLPSLKSEVIFTTAYKEYALDAFKFSASGYILKPVDDDDLVKAIDKAIERVLHRRAAKTEESTVKKPNNRIGIPNVNGVDYTNIDDILYFETISGYTRVVTKNGPITSSYSIGKFKALLKDYSFYQPHRSYIVNLNSIASYKTAGVLIMLDKKEIPVSKSAKDDLLHLFNTASRKTPREDPNS
ncbi:MAG TPA: LytTR family DNA-binding domain-containing protein [Candidatus Babeliaceae bacterium]|nr:LytTR family DNA-binding domain-containing protein [Candidatus Babeliaceae bacterium]